MSGVSIIESATKSSKGRFICVVSTLHFVTAYGKLVKCCNLPIGIYVRGKEVNYLRCSESELFSKLESDDQTTDTSEKKSDAEMVDLNQLQHISVYFGRPKMENVIDKGVR